MSPPRRRSAPGSSAASQRCPGRRSRAAERDRPRRGRLRYDAIRCAGGSFIGSPSLACAHEHQQGATRPSAIIQSVNRLLHILSVALITAGLVVLADVATTLAWREPVSSVYGSIQQHKAAGQLADLEDAFPTRADLRRVAEIERAAAEGRRTRRPVREQGPYRGGHRANRDPGHRPRRDRRAGNGHGESAEGPRPLPGHAVPRPAGNNGVRGPPNDISGPVPTPRRPPAWRPDRG